MVFVQPPALRVHAVPLRRGGRAVEHVLAGMRQRGDQVVCLRGQRVLARPAGAVEPPDLALAARGGELVEHGQHRRHADARRQQQDRGVIVLVEDEVAVRRGGFEIRPRRQLGVR